MRGLYVVFLLLAGTALLSPLAQQAQAQRQAVSREVHASHKGDWLPVVGAEGNRPIVRLPDGSTKGVSRNASLSFREAKLPVVGHIEILERYNIKTGNYRPVIHIEFRPDEDIDGLYLVVFVHYKRSKSIASMLITEVGDVKAGKVHHTQYVFNYDSSLGAHETRFYQNGKMVRVTWKAK